MDYTVLHMMPPLQPFRVLKSSIGFGPMTSSPRRKSVYIRYPFHIYELAWIYRVDNDDNRKAIDMS